MSRRQRPQPGRPYLPQGMPCGPQYPVPVRVVRPVMVRERLSARETAVHATLTFLTAGIWGFVWWTRSTRCRRYGTWR